MSVFRARNSLTGMAMLAFSMAVSSVAGQSVSAIPEPLQEKALSVMVQTQVAGTEAAPAWETKETKPTLPGSPVVVKLVGESLVVLVQVTPYQNPDGLVLVTQAQVWIRDEDKIHYHTVLNMLRVDMGEPVVFYPLGEGGGKAPLRLVIVVNQFSKDRPLPDPVSGTSDAPKAPDPPPGPSEPSGAPNPPAEEPPKGP